jgi:formamidopyrimidine-DNA glycosylase
VPELPEVEYHAYELRNWLKDQRIERAEADKTPMLRGKTTTKSFAKVLSGHTVLTVERRGKYLVFQLDDGHWLLSHLGMSGKWLRLQSSDPVPRASHAQLHLSDASVLHNVDPRMFGILQIVSKDNLDKVPEIRDLGPDPLRDAFDAHVLQKALGTSRAAIKVLLLDPKTIAGIGNIHATEALYHAKIHPSRAASSLRPDELASLAHEITATIKRGLADHERHGAVVYLSDRTGMPNPFVAYGRSGEPCPRCATTFTHIVLAGRTSVLCPTCQRLPEPAAHTRRVTPRRVKTRPST